MEVYDINISVSAYMEGDANQAVDYDDLRERVNNGDLGDLNRDGTWHALVGVLNALDYSKAEDFESGEFPDGEYVALHELLQDFEEKFDIPDGEYSEGGA